MTRPSTRNMVAGGAGIALITALTTMIPMLWQSQLDHEQEMQENEHEQEYRLRMAEIEAEAIERQREFRRWELDCNDVGGMVWRGDCVDREGNVLDLEGD